MPLFQFTQAPVQPVYRNPYAGTLAELAAAPLRIQAERETRTAANTAQAVGNLNEIAQHAIGSYVKYQEQAPMREYNIARAKEATMRTAAMTQTQAEDAAMRQAMEDAGGDPDEALRSLRETGGIGITAAGKLQKQITDGRAADLKNQMDTLRAVHERVGQASEYLSSLDDVPDAARPEAYQRIVGKVRELAGGELASKIPDEYDPTVVAQMRRLGETTTQALQRQQTALEIARQGIDAGKDARDRDKYFTASLGQSLPTTSSQEEWEAQLENAHKLGAPLETLSKFGPTYSEDAVARAQTLAVDPKELLKGDQGGPKIGSVEDAIESYGRDVLHKSPDQMSYQDKANAARSWALAHKTSDSSELSAEKRRELVDTIRQYPTVYQDLSPTLKGAIAGDLAKAGFTEFGGANRTVNAAAERWRVNQLHKVDSDVSLNLISPEDATRQRAEINASYQTQTGGSGRRGGDPAAAAAQVLRGKGPGRYRLSDGSSWVVGRDGRISPGQ